MATNTNAFYGKFIKAFTDNFNNHKYMFVVLKDKDFVLNSKYFSSDDGMTQFTTLKSKLFCGEELVKNQVYFIKCMEEGEYLGHTYCKSIAWMTPSEKKCKSLLRTQEEQVAKPKMVKDWNLSDDEDDGEVETTPPPKPKKKRKRKVVVDSDSD